MATGETIKTLLRPARRRVYWIVAIWWLRHRLAPDRVPGERFMHMLRVGWGNADYSAGTSYLRTVAEESRHASGPILECGSGLSTIVLAFYAARRGVPVFVLEHEGQWVATVEQSLRRARAAGTRGEQVRTHYATLRDQGDHDWYSVPPDLPEGISVVVCDGPPQGTRGGRYGLLPAVWDRLSEDCVILLDDAERPDEQRVLRSWNEKFGTSDVVLPAEGKRSFARIEFAPSQGSKT